MQDWLPSIIFEPIPGLVNLEQETFILTFMINDCLYLPFSISYLLWVGDNRPRQIDQRSSDCWFQIGHIDHWMYAKGGQKSKMAGVVQDLLYFEWADPLNLEDLWLPRLGGQPHMLTYSVHQSWDPLYLAVHDLLCFYQILLGQVQSLLVIHSPLICNLILHFLWLIANPRVIHACHMEGGLTDSLMEAKIIHELQCTQAVYPLPVLCGIYLQVSLSSLLSVLGLSVCLRVIRG